MNIIAIILALLACAGCDSRYSWVRRVAVNDAVMKILIIVGAFQWYDAPHLHHPLIHLKIEFDGRRAPIIYRGGSKR